MFRLLPPGPNDGMWGLLSSNEIKRDLVGFYQRMQQEYGDVVYMRLGPLKDYTFFHPDDYQEILITKAKQFTRMPRPIDVLRQWSGNSLLTTEGETWKRQRRVVQQAFQHRRFDVYAEQMVQATRFELARLASPTAKNVEFEEVMEQVSITNIGRTMFGDDMVNRSPQIGEAVRILGETAIREMFQLVNLPDWLLLPGKNRKRWAMRTLDELIRGVIRDRKAGSIHRDDFLSILLSAVDEEGDGQGLSPEEVRDQCATIFLAGHETTAAALTWIGWALAAHPEIARKATAEVDAVLGDRDPHFDDIARMPYITQVIKETLRRYPPVFALFGRQAVEDVEIGGWNIPQGGIVRVMTYVTQHDPRWFPEPKKFNPDRFSPGKSESLHPQAWLPFGAGPRACIGSSFSMMEMTLVTAMLLRRFTLAPAPGQTEPALDASQLALRPRDGLRLRLTPRVRHHGLPLETSLDASHLVTTVVT